MEDGAGAFGKMLRLDARLDAIQAMVPPCSRVADIGTDHGRLGVWLLLERRCEEVQFVDISAESLKKARLLAAKCGVSDRAVFAVGDGAKGICGKVDAAVIAGMGGDTISGIVRSGKEVLKDVQLILQPNVGVPALRRDLMESGYRISKETIARGEGRHYVVLMAEPGECVMDDEDLVLGPILRRDLPGAFGSYRAFRMRVLEKALRGARDGVDKQRIMDLEREYRIWEEAH